MTASILALHRPTDMGTPLGEDEFMVVVNRGSTGFGFNIKGTVQEGGVMQAINGRLFPPLQYISHVDERASSCMMCCTKLNHFRVNCFG